MVFINQALCAPNFLNEFFYNWYANILGAVGFSFRYGLVTFTCHCLRLVCICVQWGGTYWINAAVDLCAQMAAEGVDDMRTDDVQYTCATCCHHRKTLVWYLAVNKANAGLFQSSTNLSSYLFYRGLAISSEVGVVCDICRPILHCPATPSRFIRSHQQIN